MHLEWLAMTLWTLGHLERRSMSLLPVPVLVVQMSEGRFGHFFCLLIQSKQKVKAECLTTPFGCPPHAVGDHGG
jgi:hypothetical protein